MGHKMALSFKNNKRDNDLLKVINKQRDKSNFIKDAIEFFIKYGKSNISEINIEKNQNKIINENQDNKKENIKVALQFMKLDDD